MSKRCCDQHCLCVCCMLARPRKHGSPQHRPLFKIVIVYAIMPRTWLVRPNILTSAALFVHDVWSSTVHARHCPFRSSQPCNFAECIWMFRTCMLVLTAVLLNLPQVLQNAHSVWCTPIMCLQVFILCFLNVSISPCPRFSDPRCYLWQRKWVFSCSLLRIHACIRLSGAV